MLIYIHTAGRPERQTTFKSFTPALMERTRLVVQAHEYKEYIRPGYPTLMVLPKNITKLSPTRQWILENAETNKLVMMDDDLTFSYRKLASGVKLLKGNSESIERMFNVLELTLNEYVHAGISAREGNNRIETPSKDVGRMMRLLAYDREKVLSSGCRFDRLETKQDFDLTLQLLRKGMPNRVWYDYAHNQPGSNNAGGCSVYRTQEVMNRCAHELEGLHPDYVTVVDKTTKTSWGGGTRTDVRIAWKKAYESYTQQKCK